MKRPDVVNSDERGMESCKTVGKVFLARPWVTKVVETVPNSEEDSAGYDMYVWIKYSFAKSMNLGGEKSIMPVQIKSSDRRIKSFIHRYVGQKRFFNVDEKNHQFVLCGMDEEELVLANIVGQIVAHLSGFDITERKILNRLLGFGDKKAVESYKNNKDLLIYFWYGSLLPPL